MRYLGAIAISISLLQAGEPAQAAEGVASVQRMAAFQRQTRLLDGRAAQQYANSVRLTQPAIIVPGAPEDLPRYDGDYRGVHLAEARAAAVRHGVPEGLFLRLVTQESGWKAMAVSNKGAIGLAQLMPATAQSLGVDPRNPLENLEGGARYLAQQYRRFGSWRLALAAYNAGPEAVERHGGVPPYRETQGYVQAILGR